MDTSHYAKNYSYIVSNILHTHQVVPVIKQIRPNLVTVTELHEKNGDTPWYTDFSSLVIFLCIHMCKTVWVYMPREKPASVIIIIII